MGADLIGYMIKGPQYLSPTTRNNAISLGVQRTEALKQFRDAYEGYIEYRIGTDAPVDSILRNVELHTSVAVAYDNTALLHFRGTNRQNNPQAWQFTYEEHGWVAELDVKEVVDTLYNYWNQQVFAYGATSRVFVEHDREGGEVMTRVVFAGDSSGDEPDGAIYQAIKQVDALGLFSALEIT